MEPDCSVKTNGENPKPREGIIVSCQTLILCDSGIPRYDLLIVHVDLQTRKHWVVHKF